MSDAQSPEAAALGQRLRFLRKGKGLTLASLGERLGVHLSYIQKWEKIGSVPPKYVPALSAELGVPPSELWPELAHEMQRA